MSPDKKNKSENLKKDAAKAADFIPNSPSASADSLSVQVDDPAEQAIFRP